MGACCNALAQVTSLSPLQVRFYGDTVDVTVGTKVKGATLAEGDKVLMAKVTAAGWVIAEVLVDA